MLKVVAVRDRAIEAYGVPIFVVAIGLALRSFMDQMRDPNSEMSKHPEDYDLFHLGDFDDQNGRLIPLEVPVELMRGASVKEMSSS